MIDVVIVTEKACLKINPQVKYSAMGVEENGILKTVFVANNIKCRIVAWDDPTFDWSSTKVALIRTPWNYIHFISEFKTWVEKTSKQCKLINSKDLIIWNMDKHYLLDLQEKGISIPETYFLDRQAFFDINYWCKTLNTDRFVVKPTISGGSKDTYYLKPPYNQEQLKAIRQDIARQDTMIQQFVESIVAVGEISMVFIGGELMHAKIKKPKVDDFRVQPYHGGTLRDYIPDKKEIDFGKKVLQAAKEIKGTPIYARIDFCYGREGELLLMELEIIEPQLWLPQSEVSTNAIVSTVQQYIN